VELYVISEVFSVRSDATAEAWFAAILDFSKFGMAIAAMIRMIATTISNLINENPWFRFLMFLTSRQYRPPISSVRPSC